MNITQILTSYWEDQEKKDKEAFLNYFHKEAVIFLHDTNEKLKPNDYMSGEYDHDWQMAIDRIDQLENGQVVTVTFHRSPNWIGFITSFFTFKDDKIIELHEYFSPCDDFIVPQWREDLAEHEIIK